MQNTNIFETKDYSHLVNIGKISNTSFAVHLKLYDGYVKNVNLISEKLFVSEKNTPEWNELHRRYGWEFNGMRLHELFFDSLTAEVTEEKNEPIGEIANRIIDNFGSLENWMKDFMAIAKIRGIGWAMLVEDNKTKKLTNTFVNEHDAGMMADVKIILNVDMFEHAYISDFGVDRAAYLESIFKHTNWEVVSERLS